MELVENRDAHKGMGMFRCGIVHKLGESHHLKYVIRFTCWLAGSNVFFWLAFDGPLRYGGCWGSPLSFLLKFRVNLRVILTKIFWLEFDFLALMSDE